MRISTICCASFKCRCAPISCQRRSKDDFPRVNQAWPRHSHTLRVFRIFSASHLPQRKQRTNRIRCSRNIYSLLSSSDDIRMRIKKITKKKACNSIDVKFDAWEISANLFSMNVGAHFSSNLFYRSCNEIVSRLPWLFETNPSPRKTKKRSLENIWAEKLRERWSDVVHVAVCYSSALYLLNLSRLQSVAGDIIQGALIIHASWQTGARNYGTHKLLGSEASNGQSMGTIKGSRPHWTGQTGFKACLYPPAGIYEVRLGDEGRSSRVIVMHLYAVS